MEEERTMARRMADFREEFDRWRERFGLLGWEITFVPHLPEGDPHTTARAACTWHLPARIATVYLNDKPGPIDNTEEQDRVSAFHEACHVLLATMHSMATEYVADYLVDREIHAVINTLINAVWKPDWRDRNSIPAAYRLAIIPHGESNG